MSIYVINAILTLVWGIILKPDNSRKYRKLYIVIVSINMILLSGLRDVTIGTDTWNYENHFYEVINPELDYLYGWKQLLLNLLSLGRSYTARDIGYEAFSKLFATFIPNFRLFLFVIAAFVCIGLGRFFNRYAKDIVVSYLMFDAFLLTFMLLTGIRQTIAICLVVFWGYDLIKQKKVIKYILLCLVALLFHTSAFIAIPFYFICNRKNAIKYKYLITLIITTMIVLFKSTLYRLIPFGIYGIYAQTEGIGAVTFVTFMIIVVVMLYFLEKNHLLSNTERDDINFTDGILIAELCTTTSIMVSILFRMGFYYMFYLFCYLPKIFNCMDKRSRAIIRPLVCLLLIVYIYMRKDAYAFCF